MGRQIIKQPNGKYCVFSSIVDNIIYYDMTPGEIIEAYVEEEKESIKERVDKAIEKLESDSPHKSQFRMSYEEMLDTIKNIHGDKELQEVKKAIEK